MRLVYLSLLVGIMLLTTAKAITVDPPHYYTDMEEGTFDVVNFHITNDANEIVNVTITIDQELEGKVNVSKNNLSIPPNSKEEVTVVISRHQPLDGCIHFNSIFNNVSVPIKVNDTQPEQPPQPQPQTTNLTIIPSQPIAGKNFVLLLPNRENLTGYIYIPNSNNIYIISIINGVGMVSLSEDDYGSATIKLFGKEEYTETISISPPQVDSIYIDYPSSIKTGDEITFTVYADGDPVSAKLKFDGADNFTVKTNSFGEATVTFKKAGNYTLTVSYLGKTVVKALTVSPKPIKIQLPPEINTGEEMQIETEPNAKVVIKKDETTWTYTASADGICTFTPPFPGEYTITAKTVDREGTITFTARTTTHISVIGMTGTQTNEVKEGDVLLIQILDTNNEPVSDSNIDVYVDGMFYKTLDVVAGYTLWKVDKAGRVYEFKYSPSSEDYLPCSTTLYSSGENPISMPINSIVIILLVIVGIIVILFAFGIIDVDKIKWFFKKEKIPL